LSACTAVGAPHVLFPSDKPSEPTGPGAIVWAATGACPGGAGARVDRIGATDVPGAPSVPRSVSGRSIAPLAPLSGATGPGGRIAIAGADPARPGAGLLIQGQSGGPFSKLLDGAGVGIPSALTTAYLGDLAVAAPRGGPAGTGVEVRVERWFAGALEAGARPAGIPAGGVSGLAVAMDFRSDALAAWAHGGQIYARELPASGALRPLQRLGPAGSHPHIALLLSDDNRGMVMWSERHGASTDVYLDFSAAGVRFGAPRLIERVRDPAGVPRPEASPQLVRLSSESVMAAWSGVSEGRRVIRTAPIDQHGLRSVGTIATPGVDALLSALAPGPDGEAIVLFSEPQPPRAVGAGGSSQALLAARGVDAAPGRTIFDAPEPIAAPGAVAGATVGVDPADDSAVAAWQGAGGAIEYSIRSLNRDG
jgi:hypothetical protein